MAKRVRVRADEGYEAEAAAWARRLGDRAGGPEAPFELRIGPGAPALVRSGAAPGAAGIELRLRDARPGAEDVVRAVRGKRPARELRTVVDATAGLGGDAAALARAGLSVTMIEREPLLHALLADALERLADDPDPDARALAGRLALLHGDARELLPRIPSPDVVYLDPMYPELRGGAKRRAMAWVRELLEEDPQHAGADAALLDAARRAARRRVVLKRPRKAPALAPGATGSLVGRTTRFDLYPPIAD